MRMRGIPVLEEGVTLPIRRDASRGRKHIDWTPLFMTTEAQCCKYRAYVLKPTILTHPIFGQSDGPMFGFASHLVFASHPKNQKSGFQPDTHIPRHTISHYGKEL